MTNYQPMICPQCNGKRTFITKKYVKSKPWYERIFVLEGPLCIYEDVSIKCGYCEGEGMVAIDVDKLVKVN